MYGKLIGWLIRDDAGGDRGTWALALNTVQRHIYANMRFKCWGIFAQVSAKVKVFMFLRKEKLLIFCGKRLAVCPPPPPPPRPRLLRPALSHESETCRRRVLAARGTSRGFTDHCNNVCVSSYVYAIFSKKGSFSEISHWLYHAQ